jgi:hypothetical protein
MHTARAVLFSFLSFLFGLRSTAGELRDVREPLPLSRERAIERRNKIKWGSRKYERSPSRQISVWLGFNNLALCGTLSLSTAKLSTTPYPLSAVYLDYRRNYRRCLSGPVALAWRKNAFSVAFSFLATETS